MPHRLWQPDALVARRPHAVVANAAGLWVAVDDAADVLYRSADHGRSWHRASTGLPAAAHVTALVSDARGLLLATHARGLFRSVDQGGTWQPVDSALPRHERLSAVAPWNELLFVGTQASGIFCSADGGRSWQSVNRGLPLAGNGLSVLALGGTSDGVIASHTFGLHRAAHTAWSLASTGLPPGAVFPWIGTSSGMLVTGGATGLYRSTDAGTSWTHVFPPPASQLLTVSLAVMRGAIFAGAMHPVRGSGIYHSADGGVTWEMLGDGLPDDLTPFFLAPFPGGLVVGSSEQGVWIRPLEEALPARQHPPVTLPLVLQQNRPNPFSRTTTIPYALRLAGAVQLNVCDVLGRVVARLVDTFQTAADYAVPFDADNLEGGFYTVELILGDLRQTRQMLLLR